jgi:hypothetical protein
VGTDSRTFRFRASARHAPNSLVRRFAHKNFSRRKLADAMSREGFSAPLQTLSSRSAGVVREYSDMDEMPISQWFPEFIAERMLRARSRAMM